MCAKQAGITTIGRRKAASARVYLFTDEAAEGESSIVINKKSVEQYFPEPQMRRISLQALEVAERQDKYRFKVRVVGGGVAGQAAAVRHGIARALEKAEPELRAPLKKAGLLTRDPRVVERKKPGRHKARKKPQFSKR